MENPQNKNKEIEEKQNNRLKRITASRKRIITLMCIFVCLLIIFFIPGAKKFIRNSAYSILPTAPSTLNLPAAPYQNGKQHGIECKFAIKLLCNIYIKRIICHNDSKILKAKTAMAETLFAYINPRWSEEIKGLSEGSGVEQNILMLANSFLDIGPSNTACRQIVLDAQKINQNNTPRFLHAHNLDWSNLGGVGNFLITIFRKASDKNRLATVRIGFPGMIGALSIINSKGISLGFNQLGTATAKSKMPVFIQMRNIAETCSNFENAEKMLLKMPAGMPFCIVLADAKTGKAAVYERLRTKVNKRSIVKGILTADNIAWCGQNINSSSVNQVAQKLCKTNADLKIMKNILRNKQVLLSCNIYSVIFDYKNNAFYLAAGEIPAANGTYKKYTLFSAAGQK